MAEKKIIRDQNGRSSDSSAHWQAEKDRSAAKSRANNSGGSGGGSRQGGGVQGGGSTPQASKPVSGTGRQAKSKSPGDSSAYWLRKLEQDTLNIRKRGSSRSASGARGSSQSRRSDVPAHQSGSFLSLNASNATKRNLMELELGKLQEEAARVTGARQRDALSRRQSNVLHQLDFLDAAEGKAPRPHTIAGVLGETNGDITKKAVVPGSGKPNIYTDARQEYSEYLKALRTPSIDEYKQLQRAGANISFEQYAHQKLNAQEKSYDQFVNEKSAGKPQYQNYGNVTVERNKRVSIYHKNTSDASANSQLDGASNVDDNLSLDAKENPDPVELMSRAREKYNKENIHIYRNDSDTYTGEGFPIRFYENGEFTNISIPNSLSVTSKYEMAAIVEQIMQSEYYSEKMFGSKEHMVAHWLAHNITHDIATIENTPEEIKQILSAVSGASDMEESSKKLDLRQVGNTLKRQDIVYKLLEQFAP